MSALLEKGVNGSDIVLMNGFGLGDAGMDDAVVGAMEAAGMAPIGLGNGSAVNVVEVVGDNDQCVTGVKYLDGDKEEVLECRMVVFAGSHDCNPEVFNATNGTGLVYDGRLVVSKGMKTVDDNIYAGGTMTKFSRTIRRQVKHERYCSRETGAYMAECVLMKVDPLSPGEVEPEEVPKFTAPRGVSGWLPGGFFYARVNQPAIEPDGCTTMITGGVGEGTVGKYCALKCNPRGVICEFIYLGKEEIEVGNYSKIVGLQEAYLNSAVANYEGGNVEDWIDFFREDWSTAVMHDRFNLLHASLRQMLITDEGAFDVSDMLVRGMEEGKDDETLNTTRRNMVGAGGSMLMPSTKKLIEASGIEFLRKNKGVLNRFLLPERTGGGGD